ncbi:hypothetical protein B0H15DRAFT_974491 [Mycena belliarum]|uniref:Uncharacterized protein n=1 Tax=Mycena belliarum TaxID=1033014 RepID=A0AAD6XD97_9AGAR|nr:hypothetical protein B0H15DRAFT_974491 [Mycena belliae]
MSLSPAAPTPAISSSHSYASLKAHMHVDSASIPRRITPALNYERAISSAPSNPQRTAASPNGTFKRPYTAWERAPCATGTSVPVCRDPHADRRSHLRYKHHRRVLSLLPRAYISLDTSNSGPRIPVLPRGQKKRVSVALCPRAESNRRLSKNNTLHREYSYCPTRQKHLRFRPCSRAESNRRLSQWNIQKTLYRVGASAVLDEDFACAWVRRISSIRVIAHILFVFDVHW